MLRYDVERGVPLEKADNDGVTAPVWTADGGHLEVLWYLVEQGLEKDKADHDG